MDSGSWIFLVGFSLFISGIFTAVIFSGKGRSAWGGFFVGFLFGIIGIIVALTLSESKEVSYEDKIASGEMKVCPCGNVVVSSVEICPVCGREISNILPNIADLDKVKKISDKSTNICPYCNYDNPIGAPFCLMCAKSLIKPTPSKNTSRKELPLSYQSVQNIKLGQNTFLPQSPPSIATPILSKNNATRLPDESASLRNDLLEAELSIANGDRKNAAIIIDAVLKRDFINPVAWQLLYQLLGNGKDFPTFQKEFSSRYYPEKLHLLSKQ